MAREEPTDLITESCGNVFADLKFENPEEELAKADLVLAISRLVRAKRLTEAMVAVMIGIDQPQVSELLRGFTGGYSTDRLTRILTKLGQIEESY